MTTVLMPACHTAQTPRGPLPGFQQYLPNSGFTKCFELLHFDVRVGGGKVGIRRRLVFIECTIYIYPVYLQHVSKGIQLASAGAGT